VSGRVHDIAARVRTVRAPDEAGAEQPAWHVVRSAYAERPAPARGPLPQLAGVPIVAAIAAVLALTPAGAAVHRWIDRTLGVHHASTELFSLPAPGRVLVSGQGGAWTVAADGAKRRLGPWHQAAWSPHALYVIVAATNELTAVSPRGTPQWSIARPEVRFPTSFAPNGYRVAI
jgi:hypothetical protein